MSKTDEKHHKHVYFVDEDKYESEGATTTGALIKSKLPESKRSYSLFAEGHGKDADILINDDTTVSLDKDNSKRFYTVPPATFGKI
jgi:hypothetical protein